jgi:hypothetical protein
MAAQRKRYGCYRNDLPAEIAERRKKDYVKAQVIVSPSGLSDV